MLKNLLCPYLDFLISWSDCNGFKKFLSLPPIIPDMEIAGQPVSLADRKFLTSQKVSVQNLTQALCD